MGKVSFMTTNLNLAYIENRSFRTSNETSQTATHTYYLLLITYYLLLITCYLRTVNLKTPGFKLDAV